VFNINPSQFLSLKTKGVSLVLLGQKGCSTCSFIKPKIAELSDKYKLGQYYCDYDSSLESKYKELTDNEPLVLPKLFIFKQGEFLGSLEGTNLDGLGMVLGEICEAK
jgi:thiol-disulfide isomerase/thioredoxin